MFRKISMADKWVLLISATLFALMVSIAMIAETHAAESAVSPKDFQSLQPFKSFPKGAGEGVAYSYKQRSKADFVALLRDKNLAKKEMRVSCDVLVRQMAEAHKGLPFEGCEGTASAIESDNDFVVVSCRDDMFQRDNWLTVTDEDGSAWGVWHRKCQANEKVLTYKDTPLISLTCLNVSIPKVQVQAQPPPPPGDGTVALTGCPNGIRLYAHARSLSAMPEDLRKKVVELVGAAEGRDSRNASNAEVYKPDDVSRTVGGALRKLGVYALVNADLLIVYRDPKTLRVVRDNVGILRLASGFGSFQFADDPRQYIVETIWPMDFRSPTISGGERRMWLFPNEWKDYCSMNETGIVP